MAEFFNGKELPQTTRLPGPDALRELKSKTSGLQDIAVRAAFEAELMELTSVLEAPVPETIVGLFGGTGHGKSEAFVDHPMALLTSRSIGTTLNALFPALRLPTSDSNACTPIPILIRGHGEEGIHHTSGTGVFLEEAEFAADTKAVLDHCFSGKEHGFSEEIAQQQATARSKLIALYPRLKVEEFDRTPTDLERELSRLDDASGINSLIRDKELKFFCRTADEFAERAQKYGASAGLKNEDEVVFWPVVKEMHVQVNSSILKGGLVVVDIPGTMDTEAARANVAKQWMRKCTSPVIVASCDRAVDSQDVWDRIGDIILDNQMTGNNSRFTIVLTQIDKGLKSEAERHVTGNQTYVSLSSDLEIAEKELARTHEQEKLQTAKSQQIDRAHKACSALLVVAIGSGTVQEPSWWSQIQNQGWAEGSAIVFDTETIGDMNPTSRLDSKTIAGMMQQLATSLKEISVSSRPSKLVEKQIKRLNQEMHRCRTDAKVAAINSKIIDKVAGKMAEQALIRSQARGDDDFDSEKFQPAAFGEEARELTTVIGVCGPAAMAVLARDSREDIDERYDVWPDRESTGLVTLERFFTQLVNETVAAHEQSQCHLTRESLLKLEIMSSLDQELLKEGWWISNGMTLCARISKSLQKELNIRKGELERSLQNINGSACDKGIKDTISGVQKAHSMNVISVDPEYILKPLVVKVQELRDLNAATFRAILKHRGKHLARRKGKSAQAYDLNIDLGAHLREVTEGFFERDLRKQVYIARNHIVNRIKESFSQLHENVRKECTTPQTRNNQMLQLCSTANKREQERCILHIHTTFKALIGGAVRLPEECIQFDIKSYMGQFYDEIQLYFSDRKATHSRGEKVPGGVTNIVREKLESFVAKEASNMLHHARKGLETALSALITDTIGPPISESRENTLNKAISKLQQTYSQAFNSGQRKGRASHQDIAVLRAIYKNVQDISTQIEQKPGLGLKRNADTGLDSSPQKIMKTHKEFQDGQERSHTQTVDLTGSD